MAQKINYLRIECCNFKKKKKKKKDNSIMGRRSREHKSISIIKFIDDNDFIHIYQLDNFGRLKIQFPETVNKKPTRQYSAPSSKLISNINNSYIYRTNTDNPKPISLNLEKYHFDKFNIYPFSYPLNTNKEINLLDIFNE